MSKERLDRYLHGACVWCMFWGPVSFMRTDARKLFGFTSYSCALEVRGIINHRKIQNN
jgi:hypothetical protein